MYFDITAVKSTQRDGAEKALPRPTPFCNSSGNCHTDERINNMYIGPLPGPSTLLPLWHWKIKCSY